MVQQRICTEVLVVGGGTGGTAAAIQAARRGAQTVLVSEFGWLGGMLTSAGVALPDGNELRPWQTGIWGAFLAALYERQPGGLDHSWVSCFSYEPAVGAQIFADWVAALPNLTWIAGQRPRAVERDSGPAGLGGDVSCRWPHHRLTAVQFEDYYIEAQIILDATELGDLLALGEIPHRWGWEPQEQWQEPSAPPQAELSSDPFYRRYPVQSPTWVVMLTDFGEGATAPVIPPPPLDLAAAFGGAGDRFGPARLFSYGQLPPDPAGRSRTMLNWPICGNDYGYGLERLRGSDGDWRAWATEALEQSQGFAAYLQQQYGRRYGLATDCFPPVAPGQLGGGAFALHPYYREGRRGIGLATVAEGDLLPQMGGQVAALPRDDKGQVSAIALGNYPNDHHYPEREIPLAPKARRWGGRWTGTPFTIPYGALVPEQLDGLLFCEKNISVSHMANGATRLQPTVLAIGQAAGMAAALCLEQGCQPRELPVRLLQDCLLSDPQAPSAVIPLFNLPPEHPDWRSRQQYYLDHPEDYPRSGEDPIASSPVSPPSLGLSQLGIWQNRPGWVAYGGQLLAAEERSGYRLSWDDMAPAWGEPEDLQAGLPLITLEPAIAAQMAQLKPGQKIQVGGFLNPAGPWLRLVWLRTPSP